MGFVCGAQIPSYPGQITEAGNRSREGIRCVHEGCCHWVQAARNSCENYPPTGSDVPQSNNLKLDTYEILLGDMNGLRWVPARGKLDAASLGHRPVEGGRENDGTLLYIAQAEYKGVYHPGKASAKLDGKFDVLHSRKNSIVGFC